MGLASLLIATPPHGCNVADYGLSAIRSNDVLHRKLFVLLGSEFPEL
jgi:hypothetical protein